jgi:16S rRNA C967 or C1407 C5-methylase (RsmB/RsmF family)
MLGSASNTLMVADGLDRALDAASAPGGKLILARSCADNSNMWI